MSVKYGFQCLYLHINRASSEILAAIRAPEHNEFPHPSHPVGLLYNIVYNPKNNKRITNVLNEACAKQEPFSLLFDYQFRANHFLHTRKSVSCNILSSQLMDLQKELMPRFGDVALVRGEFRINVPVRTDFLKNLVDLPFLPTIPIRHGLSVEDADQLVISLKRRYEEKPPFLTVIGLSLGPKANSRLWGDLEHPPWQHFPFVGSK